VIPGVLAACIAAAAIVGCGGDSAETGAETLTKAEYVKRADAICAKANSQQEALLNKEIETRPAQNAASKAEREAFVINAALPPLKDEALQLEELGPPQGGEEKAQALVDALQEAVKEAEADPLALADAESQAFVPAEELARELGLEVCGGP
jgi:hypothetical protein